MSIPSSEHSGRDNVLYATPLWTLSLTLKGWGFSSSLIYNIASFSRVFHNCLLFDIAVLIKLTPGWWKREHYSDFHCYFLEWPIWGTEMFQGVFPVTVVTVHINWHDSRDNLFNFFLYICKMMEFFFKQGVAIEGVAQPVLSLDRLTTGLRRRGVSHPRGLGAASEGHKANWC